MSTIDIKFNREYLFFDPITSEAVIMKIERLDAWRTSRYNMRFKVQNYIQREHTMWEKIDMEDFNKLRLVLIAEYDPSSEEKYYRMTLGDKVDDSLYLLKRKDSFGRTFWYQVEDYRINGKGSIYKSKIRNSIAEDAVISGRWKQA